MHSIEREQILLGGLMLDNSAFSECVGLESSDFSDLEHVEIFRAISFLINECKDADVLSVHELLKNRYIKVELSYLGELTLVPPRAGAIRGHVISIRDSSARRKIAAIFHDPNLTPAQAAEQANVIAESVAPVTADWPEPTPLPNALPPVDAFDAELLPVALRPWVMDIAHLMQCPPDFPAVGAIAALSSLIGARQVIQPKAFVDWHVVPNLWALIVGRPGVMKSPALGEVMKPLNRLEATERELWQAAHESWELDCKVEELAGADREKKAKGLASKNPAAARALLEPTDTPAEPTARRYIVNDATVEKLGELLEVNPWGTLAYRDELYSLLTSLDRQGQEGSRGFYLQAYDGDKGYTFDRIVRGTHYIPRVCLSMLGGTQPGKIQKYVRDAVSGGSADDGLLQRFGLTVWPDVAGEFKYVDQWPDTPAKQAAWALFERLAQLQTATDTDPVVWRFSPEAQALFVEWLVPFETEIRGEELHPAMVSHLAKYRKLIPALALVFALIDTPESGAVIHEGELIRALAWGDYLRSHANRLYAAAVTPETSDAASLLAKIKTGKLTDTDCVMLESFTPRQIAVKGWAGFGSSDAVRKAADLLVNYDWLRKDLVNSSAAGGRPSERYTINPAAMKGGKQ
jgi:putative DNA primase/helicase